MPRTEAEAESIKQVWLTEADRKNVETVAKKLEADGIDVRRAGEISLTKVVRVLLARAAKGNP